MCAASISSTLSLKVRSRHPDLLVDVDDCAAGDGGGGDGKRIRLQGRILRVSRYSAVSQ